MKNLIPFLLFSVSVSAQTTVVLQPGACEGKDAYIVDCVPCGFTNTNYGYFDEISAIAWTNSGDDANGRGLFEFDFSDIPSTASVLNANLTLYHNPNPNSGNMGGQHSQMSGPNDAYLKQVTSPWIEDLVTWGNMPSTTTVNQVYLPASTSGTQDYIDINVTSMVQNMVADPSANFGFMLQLATESFYRGIIFASSDHPNSALHPKIVIEYIDTAVSSCITFKPNECKGKDAYIVDCVPCGFYNTNYGYFDEFSAISWTNSSNPANGRGLIEFDVSSIPANAIVTSAGLNLYHNPNPSSGNMGGAHSQLSGPNDAYLKRITSAWEEDLVTWASMPTTTNTNQVYLPASASGTQDYLDINVTAMVQEMIADPSANFGFMLQLVTEDFYRGLLFASSDHGNQALHPSLEVCYTNPFAAIELKSEEAHVITVFPNPSNGNFSVSIEEGTIINDGKLVVYSIQGDIVYEQTLDHKQQEIELKVGAGVYYLEIVSANSKWTEKLIVN